MPRVEDLDPELLANMSNLFVLEGHLTINEEEIPELRCPLHIKEGCEWGAAVLNPEAMNDASYKSVFIPILFEHVEEEHPHFWQQLIDTGTQMVGIRILNEQNEDRDDELLIHTSCHDPSCLWYKIYKYPRTEKARNRMENDYSEHIMWHMLQEQSTT